MWYNMNGGLYHLLRNNIKMKIWKTQINSKNNNQNILSLKTNDGIQTTPISKGTKTHFKTPFYIYFDIDHPNIEGD